LRQEANVMAKRKKIGEVYVERGLLSAEKKEAVLSYAKEKGIKFLDAVLLLNAVPKDQLVQEFGQDFNFDYVEISKDSLPLIAEQALSASVIAEYGVIPLKKVYWKDRSPLMFLGMISPSDVKKNGEKLRELIGMEFKPLLISVTHLADVLIERLQFPLEITYRSVGQPLHPLLYKECEGRWGKLSNYQKSGDMEIVHFQLDAKVKTEVNFSIPQNLYKTRQTSIDQKRITRRGHLISGLDIDLPSSQSTEVIKIRQLQTLDISRDGLQVCGDALLIMKESEPYKMRIRLKDPEKSSISFLGEITRLDTSDNEVPIAGVRILEMSKSNLKTWNLLVSYANLTDLSALTQV